MRIRPCFHDVYRLRECVFIDKELIYFLFWSFLDRRHHIHGFCRCCSLIKQGSIGNFHTGKIRYHGLKVDEGFKPTLGNLCLVRSVGRIPARVFHDISPYYRRHYRIVIAHAYERFKQFIFGNLSPEILDKLVFTFRHWQVK